MVDRKIWQTVLETLDALPSHRSRNDVHDNKCILTVTLWAAFNNRPFYWATQPDNWFSWAGRPQELPTQSCISRRVHRADFHEHLNEFLNALQKHLDEGSYLIVDGKPLPISGQSSDPDAGFGYASRCKARGYRLFILIRDSGIVEAWDVDKMQRSESLVAVEQLERLPEESKKRFLLGDGNYDTNRIYAAAESRNLVGLISRRMKNTGLSHSPQHPDRIFAIEVLEHWGSEYRKCVSRARRKVESYFGWLVTSTCGLDNLPWWCRRISNVRAWVGLKIALHAAVRASRVA